jgi:hypothetical protein
MDWQVELVSRHCLSGGLENKGNGHRREQRESCHGEQAEVGEAEQEAEIDRQSLVSRRCLLPGGGWRPKGTSVAASSARAVMGGADRSGPSPRAARELSRGADRSEGSGRG